MEEPLTPTNTVFFSTANDDYIFCAATSLLSIRDHIPNAKLYILSKNISNKNKRLLKRQKIDYIELDLTYLFFQTWDYPIECYYLFAGPKVFHKLGFKYSVYLDGDILCLKSPLDNCGEVKDFCGVAVNSFAELFGEEKQTISTIFNVKPNLFRQKRLHSGIVYMNNEKLAKANFLEETGKLFYQCWKNGIPRKGDDSLFALYQLKNYQSISHRSLSSIYNYIPNYKGPKIDPNTIFFHFSLDKPWQPHSYQHSDSQHNIFNPYIKTWRSISLRCSLSNWAKTLYLSNFLNKIFRKALSVIRQTKFVLKGIRYPIIKKRINLKKPPINLYWWQPPHINNFGDTMSKDIIFNLLGRNCLFSPIEKCDMIAAGSILEILQQIHRDYRLYVWGSGFIRQDSRNNNLEKAIFKAVRGNKTKSPLHLATTTGDPGLLANAAYNLIRKKHSKKIGVIIHYADMQTDLAKRLCEDHRFTIISPLDSPSNVANQISKCGLILSSSLHGLIFADSLSVPNIHIKLSNNLTGGLYKFYDYYSGINKEYTAADLNCIFKDDYLSQLKKNYQPIKNLTKIQRNLIKSFPLK